MGEKDDRAKQQKSCILGLSQHKIPINPMDNHLHHRIYLRGYNLDQPRSDKPKKTLNFLNSTQVLLQVSFCAKAVVEVTSALVFVDPNWMTNDRVAVQPPTNIESIHINRYSPSLFC